ncbi:MAG: MerR family transcriptional regulator [Caldilineaceae bacterium]|nr:MerR family transcriptional regulator [Caldilineaceae bacterium]
MADYYSVGEVSKLTGASVASIRVYGARYVKYMSPTATPEPGQMRRFSEDDVKLIAYIYHSTTEGVNHDQVQERLDAGALDSFEWNPPEEQKPEQEPETYSSALVPIERLHALNEVLQRETAERERLATSTQELQKEIARLNADLGKAQGIAETLASQNARLTRSWWRKLLGLD